MFSSFIIRCEKTNKEETKTEEKKTLMQTDMLK